MLPNNTIKQLPSTVVLEITYRCNHRCLFCSCPWDAPNSTYPKKKELSLEEWEKVICRLYDSGITSFSISGGEALLRPDLPKLIAYIVQEGNERDIEPDITVISNGKLMNEDYLQLFKQYHVHLAMSLPGYETFPEHTGVDNADGILHWFQRAKAIGLQTTVNITVTQKNYHELFRTLALGLLNGASTILLNRFLPGGRGLHYRKELELNKEQLNGMLETAEEALAYGKRYGYVGTEFPKCVIKDMDKYRYLSVGTQCAAAKSFFVIDPAGQIRTCNHSPHIVGNMFAEELITDKEYWNIFAQSQYHPTYCYGCKDITVCDCGCREVAHIIHGNPCQVDPCISPTNS